ncbi:MAG: hypothetical protein RLZZ187_371 [Pseudomonadota bacterium]|jgi:hypothetical protein
MSEADLALALTAAAMIALRGAGLLLGGVLRADHPAIAWSSSVSLATLAAFVVLALVAPTGLLATVPGPARLGGVLAGALAWWLCRGAMLPALGAGVLGLLAAWWALGGLG